MRLERERATVDGRFDPRRALAATVRYLELAERDFGRADLALESYHMGIGNLQGVLGAYDGGAPVPYAQLYFDTAPDHHAAAYQLLSSFADDSWTYYWRVLAAEQIMHLYRTDRPALERLARSRLPPDSAAEVLHPPVRDADVRGPGGARSTPTRAARSCRCRPTLQPRAGATTRGWGRSRASFTFRPRSTAGCGRPRCAAARAGSPRVSGRCRRRRAADRHQLRDRRQRSSARWATAIRPRPRAGRSRSSAGT